MIDTDSLFTISELAMDLVGVTGLIAVFLTEVQMHSTGKISFSLIASHGTLVAILGLVP